MSGCLHLLRELSCNFPKTGSGRIMMQISVTMLIEAME